MNSTNNENLLQIAKDIPEEHGKSIFYDDENIAVFILKGERARPLFDELNELLKWKKED